MLLLILFEYMWKRINDRNFLSFTSLDFSNLAFFVESHFNPVDEGLFDFSDVVFLLEFPVAH